MAEPRQKAASREPASQLVRELWDETCQRLVSGSATRNMRSFLARLEPVGLQGGALHLVARGARVAGWITERYAPLLARTVGEVFGSPLRVQIDTDYSLGGALAALGLTPPPAPAPPPTFVARPETRLAQGAVMRLARGDADDFQQILVCGSEGVGKSLLLRTFLHHRRRRLGHERWDSWKGLTLFRAFAAACRDGRRRDFRQELLGHDGLVLDEVEELAGKLRCQEQLIEVVEYYRARRRPVVVATRGFGASPREFLPAFRSQLRAGLTVTIPELSTASRHAVLAARLSSRPVPDWLLEELARASSVSLDVCIRRCQDLARQARSERRPITRETILALFPDLLPASEHAEPMDRILDRCVEFAGATRDAVVGGARTRAAALGRHLAIYLAIEVFRLQRSTVRRWLGALSPSVLPYVRGKIEQRRQTDPRIDGFLREVTEEIGRGQRFLFQSED